MIRGLNCLKLLKPSSTRRTLSMKILKLQDDLFHRWATSLLELKLINLPPANERAVDELKTETGDMEWRTAQWT